MLEHHGEMVPLRVFAADRRDDHKHSWAGLLEKMHSFPIAGEDCIAKQIHKIIIVNETLCGSLFSCHPTGSYIFPISPFGRATDSNLSECTRLCPLYTILCCWPGREIGLTVPPINPKQLLKGEP